MRRTAIALIALLIFTSCSIPQLAPATTSTPTPSPTATFTITPEPTGTPTLTPTPTITPTPTPTVDPMVSRLEKYKGMDCSNWQKPCDATAADLVDKVLLAYAKSIANMTWSEKVKIPVLVNIWLDGIALWFPQTYFPPNWKGYTGPVPFSAAGGKTHPTPDEAPFRWVAHFYLPKDVSHHLIQEAYIDIEQFHDPDGSSVFLTFQSEGPDAYSDKNVGAAMVRKKRSMLFEQMAYGSPIRWTPLKMFGKDVPKSQWGAEGTSLVFDATAYRMDQVNSELDQWAATGIIPKELENELLNPIIMTGTTPWVK